MGDGTGMYVCMYVCMYVYVCMYASCYNVDARKLKNSYRRWNRYICMYCIYHTGQEVEEQLCAIEQVYACVCLCVCTYICVCVYIYIYIYASYGPLIRYTRVYVYVCTYVCVCMHVYVCIYIYIYI